jgi:hypothetical protein
VAVDGLPVRVLQPDPRPPLEIGDERSPPLRIGGESGVVGGLTEQFDPAGALLLADRLPQVLGDHPLVAAVALAVGLRSSEDLAQPEGHALRMIRGHVRKQGSQERLLWHVPAVEDPGHSGQRREAACPLEEGRLVLRVGDRVTKFDLPVHAAAERLVPRMAAAAEAVVLERGLVSPDRLAFGVFERDPAGDPVGPVLRDFDRRLPLLIDLPTRLVPVNGETERSRGAGANGADDLVHATAARGDERILVGTKHGPKPV